jgi:hypothetical protein
VIREVADWWACLQQGATKAIKEALRKAVASALLTFLYEIRLWILMFSLLHLIMAMDETC